MKSFQHEIPKSRINITLDVDTGNAKKRKELPLKLLVLGNFSQRSKTASIADRKRVDINQHNFNGVIQSLSPQLKLSVKNLLHANADELPAQLKFDSIKDFHPDEIIKQIPELSQLLAMRNILKDLKASVLDKQSLLSALQVMVQQPKQLQKLRDELHKLAPLKDFH